MAESTESGSSEKIQAALRLLNEAARDSVDDLRTQALDRYDHLKEALLGADSTVRESWQSAQSRTAAAVVRARDASSEKVKEMATQVDESVHDNPWPYIGGAAVGGLLLGYILGRK